MEKAYSMDTTNFEAPPILANSFSYECWVKEIEKWQAETKLEPKKQGLAVFLTLDGKYRRLVNGRTLNHENGVKSVIAQLNKIYLPNKPNKTEQMFDAFEKFENLLRPKDMNLLDFLDVFDCLLRKVERFGSRISSDILAYKLMKSANLSACEERQIKSHISEISYDNMILQMKKIHRINTRLDRVSKKSYDQEFQSTTSSESNSRPVDQRHQQVSFKIPEGNHVSRDYMQNRASRSLYRADSRYPS